MRLHLYLKHFPPHRLQLTEGTEKAVHGLATGLVAQGANVTIWCEGTQSDYVLSPYGYDIQCFRNTILEPSFQISPELAAYVEMLCPTQDLVILNGIFHRSLAPLGRLLAQARIPYVVAPHSLYHPAIFQKNFYLKWPYWYLLEKPLLQKATAIQVLDQRHEVYFKQLGVQTPIVEVTNGHLETTLPQRLTRLATVSMKLLFFGRLDRHHKGLDLLLQSLAIIRDLIPVQLTLQGPATRDQSRLEQFIELLQLHDCVTLLAPEYHRSPIELMQNYDIVCLPSRYEGFGLAALEGMLAGRVLLVTDQAGIAPHVKASGCGITVDPLVPSITSGLKYLWQRRLSWSKLGARGQTYALENLQWSQIARQALVHYHSILQPSYRRSA